MKTILELRSEKAESVRAMESLVSRVDAEKRSMTADEKSAFDSYESEAQAIDSQIKDIEESEKRFAKVQARKAELSQVEARKVSPQQPTEFGKVEVTPARVRLGNMKAFDNTPEGEERAYRVGVEIAANLYNNRSAQRKLREMGLEQRTAMSESANANGAFVVSPAYATSVINLINSYGVFPQLAKNYPLATDKTYVPKMDARVTAAWVDEAASISNSEPTLTQVLLEPSKLARGAAYSSELEEDAFVAIADLIINDTARSFAQAIDEAAFLGDGTSTYGSFDGLTTLLIDGSHDASIVDAAANHDKLTELDIDDLISLMALLPAWARSGAKWICSNSAMHLVFLRLAASASGNSMLTFGGGIGPSFLGSPIVTSETLPSGTGSMDNDVMIMYGDLNLASFYGVRRNLTVKRDESKLIDTDQIYLRSTMRVAINNANLGDNSDAGAVVGLVGQA